MESVTGLCYGCGSGLVVKCEWSVTGLGWECEGSMACVGVDLV